MKRLIATEITEPESRLRPLFLGTSSQPPPLALKKEEKKTMAGLPAPRPLLLLPPPASSSLSRPPPSPRPRNTKPKKEAKKKTAQDELAELGNLIELELEREMRKEDDEEQMMDTGSDAAPPKLEPDNEVLKYMLMRADDHVDIL